MDNIAAAMDERMEKLEGKIKPPRGKPRGISKVASDLQAVIIVEVAERLRRSVAAQRSAASKASNEASFEVFTRRK